MHYQINFYCSRLIDILPWECGNTFNRSHNSIVWWISIAIKVIQLTESFRSVQVNYRIPNLIHDCLILTGPTEITLTMTCKLMAWNLPGLLAVLQSASGIYPYIKVDILILLIKFWKLFLHQESKSVAGTCQDSSVFISRESAFGTIPKLDLVQNLRVHEFEWWFDGSRKNWKNIIIFWFTLFHMT